MKHADGSVEQVAFGDGQDGGVGRETDIVQSGADRGYQPDKFKLPGFVTLGIKIVAAAANTSSGNEVFAKVLIAPGCAEPVFPLPRLVDEDGVIDPITDCNNADKTIRQRRACFLRIEDTAGELVRLVIVIEAQKLSEPPQIAIVRGVELAEVVRGLVVV